MTRGRRLLRFVAGSVAAAGLLGPAPALVSEANAGEPAAGAPKAVSAQEQREIDRAIEKSVRWLLRERNPDGSFGSGLFSRGELSVGLTSLVGLALRNGGVARDDPAVAEARTFVHRGVVQGLPSDGSQFARIDLYSAGLAVAFLLEAGEKPGDAALVQLVTFLADSYDSEGWWGYRVWNPSALPATKRGTPQWQRPTRDANASTTIYAMFGLHTAWRHGVPFDRKGPERLMETFASIQWPDGGFSYTDDLPGRSVRETATYYGGTASILASYLMAGEITGVWKRPADVLGDPFAAKSIERIGQGFGKPYWGDKPGGSRPVRGGSGLERANLNSDGVGPAFREETFNLYATERVGMLLGSDRIAGCAWYADGAARLVADQDGDGSWAPRWTQDYPRTVTTALGLLFLARAGRPIGAGTPSGRTVAVVTGGADDELPFDGATALARIDWFDLYHRAMRRVETLGGTKRADLIRRMAQLGWRVVFALADDLESDRPETRAAAGDALVALTGEDFGFAAADDAKKRAAAIAEWRQWVERHGPTLVLSSGLLLPTSGGAPAK